jgi:hypothetical protein
MQVVITRFLRAAAVLGVVLTSPQNMNRKIGVILIKGVECVDVSARHPEKRNNDA